VSVSLLGIAAPAAFAALPQSTIKTECQQAGGVDRVWYEQPTVTWSTCTYTAISGGLYRDYYENGNFYGTRRVR
jgi:hypothetical protein